MNFIYTHTGQSQMQVEIILASKSLVDPNGSPLVTVRMRYPRIIHGEIMTHRDFSRNARSSRAVPVKTMLDEVRTVPFIPWHWGANQKGMRAGKNCNEPVLINWDHETGFEEIVPREVAWLDARNQAVRIAEGFMDAGYHKQIPNRLLEPFSWIDTLITSNRWENFFWLRKHSAAEPHFQDLARLVERVFADPQPQGLNPGDWHLPYITDADRAMLAAKGHDPSILRKLSAARCARISYKPFDGDASIEREIERYNQLVTSERVHASPLEHQATPDSQHEVSADVIDSEGRVTNTLDPAWVWDQPHLHGNLQGWCQFRKTIPNEYHRG